MKQLFKRVFKKRKNSFLTQKIMKQDLYIPESAIELTSDEMEFINGGLDIRVERRGFLGTGLDLVIKMTVADAAGIIALSAVFIGSIASLLLSVPVIGLPASAKWAIAGIEFIGFIAGIVAMTDWAKETTIINQRIRLL